MAEFIARDPNAEVMGFMIQGYVAALGEDGQQYAEEFGFKDIDLYGWYSLQRLFDLFKRLSDGTMNETFDLVKVGMNAARLGIQALDMRTTLEGYYLDLPDAYRRMHRGDVGNVEINFLVLGHIEYKFTADYPCDLAFGAQYAIAQLTRPANTGFSVNHRPGLCRKHGDDHGIYDIKWWEESDESEEA